MLVICVDESGRQSSSGFWLAVNFLAFCAVAALAIPTVLPHRAYCCMNACVNNLRQLDGAAQQWALENQKKPGDRITMTDITPYLRNPLVCPQKGAYKIGPVVSNVPTCSIKGHALPP